MKQKAIILFLSQPKVFTINPPTSIRVKKWAWFLANPPTLLHMLSSPVANFHF